MKFLLVHLFSVKTVVNQTCMGRYDFVDIISMFINYYAHYIPNSVFFFLLNASKYSTENKCNLLQCRLHDIVQLGLRMSLYCHMTLCYTSPISVNNNDNKK